MMGSAKPAAFPPGHSKALWLAPAVAFLLLPTLFKPFHIDDPVVLTVAERILDNPLDPLAGEIDWLGRRLPLWEVTTNPPLLSYILAPPLAWFGASEAALHLTMTPFLVLLVYSTWWLARRFCPHPLAAAACVIGSPAILTSINLMRDVPAAALTAGGLVLAIRGVDENRAWRVVGGALALGLAIVTKYSSAALLPVLMLYPLRRQPRMAAAASLGMLPLICWSLATWLVYGQAHPLFLLLGKHAGGSFGATDNLFGALAVLGASLPAAAMVAALGMERRRLFGGLVIGLAAAAAAAANFGTIRIQFSLWAAVGTALTVWAVGRALTRLTRAGFGEGGRDGLFLLAWLTAPLGFSILLAPFQAVRHLIPALFPLTLLAFRGLPVRLEDRSRRLITGGVVLQTALAAGVAAADFNTAACYRDAAVRIAESTLSDSRTVWFVGHWGWKTYAERAGLRQLHADGSSPQPGDLLAWPRRVHIGNVFSGHPGLRQRLELVDRFDCQSILPLRTMNFEGAAFYAVIRGNSPYAFQTLPLDTFRLYRVQPEGPEPAGTK